MRQPGSRIGPWRLTRPLGEGPFGVVWLAEDPDGRAVVLKLLREAFVQRHAGQAAFSRLLSSVRIHEQIRHENLVEVYAPVQQPLEQALGLSMEYLEGRMLSSVQLPPAAREGQDARSLAVLLGWFEDLGNALSWLHAQGIIHGNLKPSNVMLVRHGNGHQMKVLDTAWSAIGLAAPSAGIPSFLAPEQIRGAAPTAASDQWSMATLLSQILVGGLRPLTLGTLPAVLVLAVQRATQENPAQRFPRVDDLVGALHAIRNELMRGDQPSLRPDRQTPRLGVGASPQGFHEEPDTVRTQKPRPGPASDLRGDPGQLMPRSVAFTESGGALPVHRDPVPVPHARPIDSKESSGDLPYAADGPEAGGAFHAPMQAEPSLGFDSVNVSDHGPSFGPTASVSTPELMEDGPTAIRARQKKQPLLLAGAALMLVAGGIVFAAWKMSDFGGSETTVQLAPPPVTPPPATPPEDAPPPPAPPVKAPPPEEPPPIPDSPPKTPIGTPPPKAPPPPPPPPPPPAKVVETEPKPRPEPPKPKEEPQAPDLDEAVAKLARLGEAPPPPGDDSLGPRELSVACDEGDGDACLKIAAFALKKGDSAAARNAFERACDFGRGSGCLDAGDLWSREGATGEQKARKLYERACNQAVASGCHQLSTWLEEGRGGPADPARAAELEKKACQLGRKTSCAAAPAIEKLPDDPPPSKTSTKT